MKYAVLVLGILAASYTIAQNHLEDFTLKRSLKQDGLQFNFTVLDDDKRGVKHHKPSKFYYWFKAQHVRATQGASSGRLLHGKFEAFYPDKQLAQQGSYKKGLKHGKWQYWYPDGSFKKVENVLSLGRQTWPHLIVRIMLVEQIYRSLEIMKGTSYHK